MQPDELNVIIRAASIALRSKGGRVTARNLIKLAVDNMPDDERRSELLNAIENLLNPRGAYDDNALELIEGAIR